MFKFTKTRILYALSSIFFILIQIFINQYQIKTEINQNIMVEQHRTDNKINQNEDQNVVNPQYAKEHIEKSEFWQIEIPTIALVANIEEGTDKEILNQYVGHFTTTQKEIGNIGLAAHNRGYKVNYFENLKKLKQGDKIKYIHNQYQQTYIVEENIIIKDTDWEKLENTEEDKLTLITCVENEPEYRRCVQAIKEEMEENY